MTAESSKGCQTPTKTIKEGHRKNPTILEARTLPAKMNNWVF